MFSTPERDYAAHVGGETAHALRVARVLRLLRLARLVKVFKLVYVALGHLAPIRRNLIKQNSKSEY